MTTSFAGRTAQPASVLVGGFLAGALVLMVSTHAGADPLHNVARAQARAGKLAYESHDFKRASLKFELAFEAQKTPAIALWRARAVRQQGQFTRALALYEQVLAMSRDTKCKTQARIHAAAKAERQDLLLRMWPTTARAALSKR